MQLLVDVSVLQLDLLLRFNLHADLFDIEGNYVVGSGIMRRFVEERMGGEL